MSCVNCGKKFGLFNRAVTCPLCNRELCHSCLSYTLSQPVKPCCGKCYHMSQERAGPSHAQLFDVRPEALQKLQKANLNQNNAGPSSMHAAADPSSSTKFPLSSPAVQERQQLAATSVTDENIARRLAKLRGESAVEAAKPDLALRAPVKTTQELEDELLKAAMAELEIEKRTSPEAYIEKRLENLRRNFPVPLGPTEISFANTEGLDMSMDELVEAILKQAQSTIRTSPRPPGEVDDECESDSESDDLSMYIS